MRTAVVASLGLLAFLWPTPAFAGKGKDRKPPPEGTAMYRTGLAFTITGAVGLVGGTVLFPIAAQAGPGTITSIDALVLGGGFLTMGGLLMHFGEERRFAYVDWREGRPTPDREHTRRPGAGAILSGTLTLAGGGAVFAFGASSALATCQGPCDDSLFVVPQLTIGATAVVLGGALMVVGIRNRSRYLDWRVSNGRMVLLPTAGPTARGAFIGLSGRF